MGAELYIRSLFNEQNDLIEPQLLEWMEKQKALQQSGKADEALKAKEKADALYKKLYVRGYFRDSYNSNNLLWKFGLNPHETFDMLMDDFNCLQPVDAQTLLDILQERETIFEERLNNLELTDDESLEEAIQYFHQKYERFKDFLEQAIALDEEVVCSV